MKLDPAVAALVLLAALLHASWNAIVKSDSDRLASLAIVMLSGAVIALAVIPFLPVPNAAAWPYLLASTAIHVVYFHGLLAAYAHGDLSHVYPIARGMGPVLVALLSGRFAGEHLSASEAAGLALVSIGIASLAFAGGSWRDLRRGTFFAALTGITIGGYSVVDGLGVRAASDALSYIAWLFLLQGIWLPAYALARRGSSLLPYLRVGLGRNVAGGAIAMLGYGIAIWAMRDGAMAHVSALRETAVLFGAAIGCWVLKEPFGARRIAAAALVVAGLIAMNLQLG